ncbi:prolyl oligopeptidase family serine peptidase [Microlunatus sp. Gsoil 973]|uniref:S9 family peptidase n=1 Tax=Microlunatus sp. Gsoil 973 TaxID=2672569 RepID=UPI0012B4C2E8|nr:prolyl oligopeptidase family serine peptidase [Microlunatus sp. Gsoil 973]QGN32921.1 prolyl oligopeptidase family serine peptidase [Microlunatus sp. Gsoil 973]
MSFTSASDRAETNNHEPSATGSEPDSRTPDPDEQPLGSPWEDLRAYVATPRLGSLLLSQTGTLLVSVSELNHDQTGYRTGWWSVDPTGAAGARRLTRSTEGESVAAYLPDGSLIFGSGRPAPPAAKTYGPKPGTKPDDSDGVLWCLPAGGGEAYPIARRAGGWRGVSIARKAPRAVFSAAALAGVDSEGTDQELRKLRKTKKVSAILHEGYPVRFWDHDLGEQTRLYTGDLDSTDDHGDLHVELDALTRLFPQAGRDGVDLEAIADDGSFVIINREVRKPRGKSAAALVEIDLTDPDAEPVVRAEEADVEFGGAVISPDGALIAAVRRTEPTTTEPPQVHLWLIDRATGQGRVLAADWDRWPQPVAFSPDASVLYVIADEDGDSPLFEVDLATEAPRRLTERGAYGSAVLSDDGATVYAIRTSYTDPGGIVAIDTATGASTELPAPVSYPELPGTLVDVEAHAPDGVRIRGYLALPEGASADRKAPLALWIHGGPLGSWNAWSWRWSPWLLVSQGYAVLLPDPALSTGYGQEFIKRGWGRWGAEPYTDLMAITDAVVTRDDIDETDTVAMGGSFGGYMANWVAGHTDRFKAIVTHASLWNLGSFRYATDNGVYWLTELNDRMVAEYSPHLSADRISTPMLVIHGDKDYRVPITEGLGLWTELVSRHDGDPEDLPHKFLYFPDENHWILKPQHAIVWYETVLSFLESVRTGGNFARSRVL